MRVALVLAGLLLTVTACSLLSGTAPALAGLRFAAQVAMTTDGEASAELGIHNDAGCPFPGDENLDAVMQIRDVSGTLRARAWVKEVGNLAPHELRYPLRWHGQLSPGDYTLTWGAGGYGATAIDFRVFRSGETWQLTTEGPRLLDTYEPELPARGMSGPILIPTPTCTSATDARW
jgi:hypothetical protein